jgi:hexosaminidase
MVYPRACAMAEIAWSAKEKKNWKDFSKRLKTHFTRLDALGVNYAKTFFDVTATVSKGKITLSTLDASSQIRYTTNGKDPSPKAKMYSAALSLPETTTLKAAVFQGDKQMGNIREIEYQVHKATGKPYKMTKTPDKYTGGEVGALTDGVSGVLKTWGRWVGLVNSDIDPVIDLGTATEFKRITTHYLYNNGSRIYPPRSIEVFGSNDGKNFTSIGKQTIDTTTKMDGFAIETVKFETKKAKYRYVKLVATAFGVIPEGAPGAGNGSWLFLDEVAVE